MNITVLDADTLGGDLDLTPLSALGSVTVYGTTKESEIASRIEDSDVVLINKVKIRRETAGSPKHLRLITVAATGYDNVDLSFCRENGIGVANVPGYSTDSVAQLTVSMALMLITRLTPYLSFVKSGDYSESGMANRLSPTYHEIAGKTWGIVGLGAIGKRVAKVAEALGCRVIANKRTPDENYTCVSLETLCREADIISIHTPLTEETRGLIGEKEIALMKKDAIVINVARGAVWDENAIVTALENGKIGALGCDVYNGEPFSKDSPFTRILNYDNACLTPHMAWGGYETRVRLLSEICRNIEALTRGERRNRVDS